MKKKTYVVRAILDDTGMTESPRNSCYSGSRLVTASTDYNFAGAENDEDNKRIGVGFEDAHYQGSPDKVYLEWVYADLMPEGALPGNWDWDPDMGFYKEPETTNGYDEIKATEGDLEEIFEVIATWELENLAIRAVCLFDHSGLSMSTTPFSCRWDSGQVGYIYMLKEEYLKCTEEKEFNPQHALAILDSEIKEFSSWLEGDVWGVVYAEVTDTKDITTIQEDCDLLESVPYLDIYWDKSDEGVPLEEEPNEIDSCWGYIGYDYVKDVIEADALDICRSEVLPHINPDQLFLVRVYMGHIHNSVIKVPRYKNLFLDRPSFLNYLGTQTDISDISWEVV